MTRRKRQAVKEPYGLKVQGNIRIFRKDKVVEVQGKDIEFSDLWFNVSTKISDDEYENKSMKVIINKEFEMPDNNTIIKITDAWFMLSGQGEYQRITLYVNEWE